MTGRGIDQVMPHPVPPILYERWVRDARDYVRLAERVNGSIAAPVPPHYIWGDALAEIERVSPQLRVVNLETAATRCDAAQPHKGIHYRMHPSHVDCLTAARIDACSLANNHVLDWGSDGLRETLDTLHRHGVRTSGAGVDLDAACAPAVLAAGAGARVLLSAWATPSSGVPFDWAAQPGRPGVALLPELDEDAALRVAAQVARERAPGDIVVVSLHWGANWVDEVPVEHRAFAHRLIDLGAADVVHGHSSHHALPIELYRGRLILYGCGDLVNDYEGIEPHGSQRCDLGCLYFAGVERGSGLLRRLEIVPMRLQRFQLVRALPADCDYLACLFNDGGARLGTCVEPTAGGWLLRWS
jgi:poly-gamma-glutamate capsule biosynthesis protein CapA/YwtB (metallophosphatase superfamily)